MARLSIIWILTFLLIATTALVNGARPPRCLQGKRVGNCRASIRSFYYDPQTNDCEEFFYGGCGGNGNRFPTYKQCKATCMRRP